MPAKPRHGTALNDGAKINYPVLPGMAECLTAAATDRGMSRSEYLRRVIARAIVTDTPPAAWEKLAVKNRDRIERIANLPL